MIISVLLLLVTQVNHQGFCHVHRLCYYCESEETGKHFGVGGWPSVAVAGRFCKSFSSPFFFLATTRQVPTTTPQSIERVRKQAREIKRTHASFPLYKHTYYLLGSLLPLLYIKETFTSFARQACHAIEISATSTTMVSRSFLPSSPSLSSFVSLIFSYSLPLTRPHIGHFLSHFLFVLVHCSVSFTLVFLFFVLNSPSPSDLSPLPRLLPPMQTTTMTTMMKRNTAHRTVLNSMVFHQAMLSTCILEVMIRTGMKTVLRRGLRTMRR